MGKETFVEDDARNAQLSARIVAVLADSLIPDVENILGVGNSGFVQLGQQHSIPLLVCNRCFAGSNFLSFARQTCRYTVFPRFRQYEGVCEGILPGCYCHGLAAAGQPDCITAPAEAGHGYEPVCDDSPRGRGRKRNFRVHRHIFSAAIQSRLTPYAPVGGVVITAVIHTQGQSGNAFNVAVQRLRKRVGVAQNQCLTEQLTIADNVEAAGPVLPLRIIHADTDAEILVTQPGQVKSNLGRIPRIGCVGKEAFGKLNARNAKGTTEPVAVLADGLIFFGENVRRIGNAILVQTCQQETASPFSRCRKRHRRRCCKQACK